MTLKTNNLQSYNHGSLPARIVATVEPRQFQVEGDDCDIYHIVADPHSDWIPLVKYGCFIQCDPKSMNDGLFCAAMNADGTMEDEIVDVTAPENQEFLDACNAVLGTDFRFHQFAGR